MNNKKDKKERLKDRLKLNVRGADIEEDIISTDEDEKIAEEIVHGSRYNFPPQLSVSSGPHVKVSNSVSSIMLDVIIALMPAYIWGILVFGTRALALGMISVASCVIFEFFFQLICGRKNTIGDLSAVVTGLILAMNLSAGTPYWLPVVGAFFAIVVVKGLFGGIGKNILNPALAARVFMFLAWPDRMKIFTAAGNRLSFFSSGPSDITASATPLTVLHSGQTPSNTIFDLFIGNVEGCIGEVSVLFLLIGAVYLFARRVITWHTPVAYIALVAVVALIFPRVAGDPVNSMLTELFSGGLIFCAFFMATDYATTPVAPLGKIIFGIGCGLITVLIRYKGGYSEGASFSILIMNLLVWYIDRLTLAGRKGGKSNAGK